MSKGEYSEGEAYTLDYILRALDSVGPWLGQYGIDSTGDLRRRFGYPNQQQLLILAKQVLLNNQFWKALPDRLRSKKDLNTLEYDEVPKQQVRNSLKNALSFFVHFNESAIDK